jgi:hypothetical protein
VSLDHILPKQTDLCDVYVLIMYDANTAKKTRCMQALNVIPMSAKDVCALSLGATLLRGRRGARICRSD